MSRLVLIDGNALMFRVYYATAYTGNMLRSKDGTPTNALYGMVRIIDTFLETLAPDTKMLIAFDAKGKTFRHTSFSDYKGGRKNVPDELIEQIPLIKKAISYFGVNAYEEEGIEADDIIGITANQGQQKGYDVEIYTSDNDLLQLVDKNIKVFLTKRGFSELEEINEDNFVDLYSVHPDAIPDLKALMGDSSDNIPGIKGIGKKSATALIQEFSSIANIYQNLANIKESLRTKLIGNEEDAKLYKSIATIIREKEIEIEIENCDIQEINRKELSNFLHHYNINSIARKYEDNTSEERSFTFEPLTEKDVLKKESHLWINFCEVSSTVYLVIGTENKGWYCDAGRIENLDFLSNKNLIFFVYKKFLRQFPTVKDVKFQSFFDLGLVCYILNTDIKNISKANYFFNVLEKNIERSVVQERELKNALQSFTTTFEILEIVKKAMGESKLTSKCVALENQVQSTLIVMEDNGISIDKPLLAQMHDEIFEQLNDIKEQILVFSNNKDMNVNSPKQLAVFLYDELKLSNRKKRSTNHEALEAIEKEHEVVSKLMQYRSISKLFSTYIKGFGGAMKKDGKIHTVFGQNETATGRLSSKNPNVQNISIRNEVQKKFRKIFVPSKENHLLISADYSQIELRIVAHLAKDADMIQWFKEGRDVHTHTASRIFNKTIEKITDHERQEAKRINFGILYGMSSFGLSKELKIPIFRCEEYIDSYFENFPKIKEYQNKLIKEAEKKGYLETFAGRKRYFPDLQSRNKNIRKNAERTAINFPIQGSAADLIKIAMVQIQQKIDDGKIEAAMLIQIHDELIFEAPENSLSVVTKEIERTMESVIVLETGLKVNVSSGKNLYNVK